MGPFEPPSVYIKTGNTPKSPNRHAREERARRVNSYTRSGRPIARRLDIEPEME